MHPIYFVCKLLSVGFQHCLTIAYSKTVYWHCLVAITPKGNRINVVFLSLICREWFITLYFALFVTVRRHVVPIANCLGTLQPYKKT